MPTDELPEVAVVDFRSGEALDTDATNVVWHALQRACFPIWLSGNSYERLQLGQLIFGMDAAVVRKR